MTNTIVPCADKIYMHNTYKFEEGAKVTQTRTEDVRGKVYHWVILNQTIFHPQGGGQRADQGTIADKKVVHVGKANTSKQNPSSFDVKHYFAEDPKFQEGQEVLLQVDETVRRNHAALHTAGHLLAPLAEALDPNLKATNGHHFPGEARVTFKGVPKDKKNLEQELNQKLAQSIQDNVKTKVIWDTDGMRQIQVGEEFPPVGCGGTHISDLNECKEITIRSIKSKKGSTNVGYNVKV